MISLIASTNSLVMGCSMSAPGILLPALQDEHDPLPLEDDGAKAKLLQKFEVINGLVGNSREASFIKNRYLKMLLSRSVLGGGTAGIQEVFDSARSIDSKLKFNVNSSLYDSKNLQKPHKAFAANS